jgi:transcriptional regulator
MEQPKAPLLRGALEMLVLRILEREPRHGFGISRRLADLSEEWLKVDEGSLYPCLYRMEERGWIRSKVSASENNRRARYYTLTESGKEELRRQTGNWRQLSQVVGTVLKRG